MEINIAERVKFTEEYYFAKKLREIEQLNKEGQQVINLGIGSPDLPPAEQVIHTLVNESQNKNTHGYQSYRGIAPFRQAIADWYDQHYHVHLDSEREILPLLGSKEGIMHICMTYLQEGDDCLIPNPGYPTYQSAVKISGARPLAYSLSPDNNWLPNLEQIEREYDMGRIKLMWLNYPHMPTGGQATPDFFKQLVAFAKRHQILLCNDNPYSFILTERPLSLLSIEGAMDCAIELNSFSKTFNMAGWRMGMLLANSQRINEIMRFKSNMDSGMYYAFQKAAVSALKLDTQWYENMNTVYAARRAQVFKILDRLNCTYDPKQVGLFVWAAVPQGVQDGYVLSDQILQLCQVFITPGGIFGSAGRSYIRISLCSSEETLQLALDRLKKLAH